MAEAIFDVVDLSIDPEGTGTAASFKVDLGTGAQGPKGDTGDEGPAGADGADGESAYQLAVDAGFSGTLSQWLASLVGAKGDQGDPGTNGTDGADGSDGRGITSVARTSGDGSPGTTDTYTITYSDATTSTFTVYNGADGTGGGGGAVDSVNGQTGTVVLTASDVDADASGAASSAQTAAEGYTDSAIASEVTRADAAYATAAQGSTADSAVQPGDLATVATTGAYSDLTGEPTLGTAAPLDVAASGNASSVQVVKGNDTRLSDSRTPTAHASSHASAGSDPITIAESQVTNLTTDLAAKLAKASNLSDVVSASAARTNLGLGTAATVNTGTASGNIPLLSTGGLLPIARIASGTADGTKFVRDDGTLAVPSGGSGTVKDPRWNVLTGQTTIDEHNDSSIGASWIRVDGTGAASGNLVWTEDGDVLSASNGGGDTAACIHAYLFPLSGVGGSLSVGDGFVTCVSLLSAAANYAFVGLTLANGTTYGSGSQVVGVCGRSVSSNVNAESWAMTGFNARSSTAGSLQVTEPKVNYMRLSLISANTWRTDCSIDGVSWMKGSATLSQTVTPTHVGYCSTSYGTATAHVVSFEFLRRVSGVT